MKEEREFNGMDVGMREKRKDLEENQAERQGRKY